jgi:inner membrane protein
MASFGHVAVGLAAGRAYAGKGSRRELARAMLAFSVVSLVPDADVLAFVFGIPYGAPFGHRGASHSIAFAVACAALAGVGGFPRRAIYTFVVTASHGVLDAMTDGGRGVALFWPLSMERIFFPWRPIPVAPIGRGLFSGEGFEVIRFELIAFLPFVVWALWPRR